MKVLRTRYQENRGVLTLIVITVLLFLVDQATDRAITIAGGKSYRIWSGELYRLVSATFLHGGVGHIVTNMFGLWIFGPIVERLVGTNRFVLLYVISGAVGYVVSLLASPGAIAVGASASIFGLMGYVLHFRFRRLPRRWSQMDTAFVQILAINIVAALIVPNIDQWAHVGGLLGGALAGSLVGFGPARRSRPGLRRREAALAGILVALIFFVGLRPLDAAHLVERFAPGIGQSIEAEYARYFMPFTVTSPTLVWNVLDPAGDWVPVGERITVDPQRPTLLGFAWWWERGVNHSPNAVLEYQVLWRRNGAVVDSFVGRVSRPGYDQHVTSPLPGSLMAGDWEVSIISGGVELASQRVVVRIR